MPKFIKTITTEVLDTDSIRDEIARRQGLYPNQIRLVMSPATLQKLRVDFINILSAIEPQHTAPTPHPTTKYYGCVIDLNDSLEFGDVLFTVRV